MTQEREAIAPMEIEAGRKLADWLREREDTNYAALVDRLTSAAELALRSGGEGWRLVPVEPTGAMLLRGCDAAWPGPECVYDDAFDGPEHQLQAAYRAMLAAAPSPSTHGEG